MLQCHTSCRKLLYASSIALANGKSFFFLVLFINHVFPHQFTMCSVVFCCCCISRLHRSRCLIAELKMNRGKKLESIETKMAGAADKKKSYGQCTLPNDENSDLIALFSLSVSSALALTLFLSNTLRLLDGQYA